MQNVVLVMLSPEELKALIQSAVREALSQQPQPVQAPEPAAEYLNTKDAAKLLGISTKGLEGLRARGAGPKYIRIGHAIRYRRSDLAK